MKQVALSAYRLFLELRQARPEPNGIWGYFRKRYRETINGSSKDSWWQNLQFYDVTDAQVAWRFLADRARWLLPAMEVANNQRGLLSQAELELFLTYRFTSPPREPIKAFKRAAELYLLFVTLENASTLMLLTEEDNFHPLKATAFKLSNASAPSLQGFVYYQRCKKSPLGQKVRALFVDHFLPLVGRAVREMNTVTPSLVKMSDLYVAGVAALPEVVDAFDPLAGQSFEEFAVPQVKRAMWRVLCQNDELRSQFLREMMPLVKNVSGRMSMGFPVTVELGDLCGAGYCGLIETFEKFDPTRGIKFETYAVPRIRGAILDNLRDLDWVPRSVRAGGRALEEAMIRLTAAFGRSPFIEDLADHMSVDYATVYRMIDDRHGVALLSLDEMVYREDDNRQVPRVETLTVVDDENPFLLLERRELYDFLHRAVCECLTIQEAEVIGLYYYQELTLKEIGESMRISESRVSQIHTKAIGKLTLAISQHFDIPLIEVGEDGVFHRHRYQLPHHLMLPLPGVPATKVSSNAVGYRSRVAGAAR